MERTIGEKCPRIYNFEIKEENCKHCSCFDGVSNGYVICKHSELPTFESPFNVGDECYYLDCGRFPTKAKIRECLWYGTEWKYKVTRKQSLVTAYKTEKECKEALAKQIIDRIKGELKEAIYLVGKERFLELGKDIKLLQ